MLLSFLKPDGRSSLLSGWFRLVPESAAGGRGLGGLGGLEGLEGSYQRQRARLKGRKWEAERQIYLLRRK